MFSKPKDIFSNTVIKTNKTIPVIKKNKMNLQIYLTNYKKKKLI